jgi:hypothetical protein
VAGPSGGAGGGIGYSGLPTSIGVEFDSFDNGTGLGDLDGNHVAIDKNGFLSPSLAYANLDAFGQLDQLDGIDRVWYSWVDYNGATDLLEVRVATALDGASAPARPGAALISASLDLPAILGDTDAFVGFTAGTGAAANHQDVLSMVFRDTFDPIPTPTPESDVRLVALLVVAGLIGWHVRLRRKNSAPVSV